jgi:hypothetical protein
MHASKKKSTKRFNKLLIKMIVKSWTKKGKKGRISDVKWHRT